MAYHGGMTMRCITMVLAGVLLLTGCGGGGDDEDQAAVGPSETQTTVPQASAGADKEATLKTAIAGYSNAFLGGDYPGYLAYLDEECQGEEDRASALSAAQNAHEMADGATMTIDSVEVDGDRGRVKDWHLSDGAPDALRRALKASTSGEYTWRFVDDEWYFRSKSCTGK